MNAIQSWVTELTVMQQSTLLSAIRGPDTADNSDSVKPIVRWLRRCVLESAFDKGVLDNPSDSRGGVFTGPSYIPDKCDCATFGGGVVQIYHKQNLWEARMNQIVVKYTHAMDYLPVHYVNHLAAAIEILGYKHPNERIRNWWNETYYTLARKAHLKVESLSELDRRLDDNEEAFNWRNGT